jgi:hypothetical protein
MAYTKEKERKSENTFFPFHLHHSLRIFRAGWQRTVAARATTTDTQRWEAKRDEDGGWR